MSEYIENLRISENKLNNMMEDLRKVYAEDQIMNKENLRSTIEKAMDGTKKTLLDMLKSDECLSNKDGSSVITATKKETNIITDPSQLKGLTLPGVPSNTGLGSQAVATVSTGGAGSQAKAKVAGATALAVTTAEKDERSYVLAFLERIGNKLKSFFQWLWDKMKQMAQDVKDAVCTAFSTVWGWLTSAWACLTGGS